MACLKQRGETFYLQWYQGGQQRRRSLETESFQVAKERLRQFESAQHRGEALPLPTRTPIGDVVEAFVAHMRAHRPERSWRRDVSYLRESFGEVCPALELSSERARLCRERRSPQDRRRKLWPIAAPCFEEITTAAVSDYRRGLERSRGRPLRALARISHGALLRPRQVGSGGVVASRSILSGLTRPPPVDRAATPCATST